MPTSKIGEDVKYLPKPAIDVAVQIAIQTIVPVFSA